MQKLYMKKFNGDISNLAMLSFDNNTIIEIEQDKVKDIVAQLSRQKSKIFIMN